ncbi:MAG: hypothetical protein ABIY70_18510 [Capsulimonas sp.]|uniref:hypothetical protein n=1 Tax=Capsulimonas sp. TaxID=2494211 RepID=UPI0032650F1B
MDKDTPLIRSWAKFAATDLVNYLCLACAIKISGLWPAVSAFIDKHPWQICIACLLYCVLQIAKYPLTALPLFIAGGLAYLLVKLVPSSQPMLERCYYRAIGKTV